MSNLDCLKSSLNNKKLKQNQSLNKIPKFRAFTDSCSIDLNNTSFDGYEMSSSDAISNSPNERNRLISINEAFDILRVNIPTFPYERRLSKIDTLHLAISYINLLELVLESNMSLYDYIKATIFGSFGSKKSNRYSSKPVWATSGNEFGVLNPKMKHYNCV
jgi:hypothetical protein